MITWKGDEYTCVLDILVQIIKGKWVNCILCHLNTKTMRFQELRRAIDGKPSQKVLTGQLKQLEEYGIVYREVQHTVPIKTYYSLTLRGKRLRDLQQMALAWSFANFNGEGPHCEKCFKKPEPIEGIFEHAQLP